MMWRSAAVVAATLTTGLLVGCGTSAASGTPSSTAPKLTDASLTVTWTPPSGRFVTSSTVPASGLIFVCYWGANLEVVRGGKLGITAPDPAYAAGAPRNLPDCKGMPPVS